MSKNKGKLPDFIGCGFQKCATSALTHNLNQHPDITIPRNEHPNAPWPSEFNFFSRSSKQSLYHLGLDWYKSNFADDGNIHGEISPNYGRNRSSAAVPKLIYDVHPNVKILFTMRNPIDRAYSAYNHYLQEYPVTKNWGSWQYDKSFMWNVENSNSFHINYIEVIKKYETYFSENQMHFIIQEKLKKDPQKEYNKIFGFLGVEYHQMRNKKIHAREKKRMLTRGEIEFLADLYKDEVDELFDWLGYEIKEWTEFC